jgi:hypothetical protein
MGLFVRLILATVDSQLMTVCKVDSVLRSSLSLCLHFPSSKEQVVTITSSSTSSSLALAGHPAYSTPGTLSYVSQTANELQICEEAADGDTLLLPNKNMRGGVRRRHPLLCFASRDSVSLLETRLRRDLCSVSGYWMVSLVKGMPLLVKW